MIVIVFFRAGLAFDKAEGLFESEDKARNYLSENGWIEHGPRNWSKEGGAWAYITSLKAPRQ